MDRTRAILLIGPSGSGKSPLGALLEKRMGWAHFDFGHELRLIARGEGDFGLVESEREYIRDLLHEHSLFPNDKFDIVEKILADFLYRHNHTPGVILNGLPRHVGQAEGVSRHVDIKSVVVLDSSKRNSIRCLEQRLMGLARKFVLYTKRTEPLIDHYEGLGVNILRIPVGHGTSESDIAADIISAVR